GQKQKLRIAMPTSFTVTLEDQFEHQSFQTKSAGVTKRLSYGLSPGVATIGGCGPSTTVG
ncbi:hypothetical protein, partial [Acidithiobacillus thiooxidans]|uniref:hypothetical protein n=1 Tax=Acidithiobacillus thiooxidans TaxID=930 RepID=UPI001EE6472A